MCLLCNVCGSLVQKPGIMKRKRGEARISSTLVLNVSGQLETCTLPKITSLPPIPPQSTSSKIWNDKYACTCTREAEFLSTEYSRLISFWQVKT